MAKVHLEWKRSQDGMEAALEMHVEGGQGSHVWLDGAGLEDWMRCIADARASLVDEVPRKLEDGMRLMAMADPAWRTEGRHDFGGAMLALRHPGLGWLSFLLPPNEARALGASLVEIAEQFEAKDGRA